MVKKPTRHDEPEEATATQSESATAPPMPPMPQGREAPPRRAPGLLYDDPTSDANTLAIIDQQILLQRAQWTEVSYLATTAGIIPPTNPPPVPPSGAQLQQISDTLAGANRAFAAYISQLNTLLALWPPTPASQQSGVNGNGGTP